MIFHPTSIPDMYRIELEPLVDERGYFARTWCRQEFLQRGLRTRCVQSNVSFNARRGTLRGMHYQVAPYEEAKLIRVLRGAIHDVVLDMRPGSPARGTWHATELSADSCCMLYVPEGCAHGFLTLTDATEIHYQMSEYYHPASARGVRWDDPLLREAWPFAPLVLSERDLGYQIQFAGAERG